MLAVNCILIAFYLFMIWAMYRYWLMLRDPASAQSEFWKQRSTIFLTFQVYFLPLLIISFLFHLVNNGFNVYLLLR